MELLVAFVAILAIAGVAARVSWCSFHAGHASSPESTGESLPHWPATGGFDIHALAEMADSDAIATLASAPDAGAGLMYATATLRIEPAADHPMGAVSVLIDDRHAAYLDSADAADYRARLHELGLPQAYTTCDAIVRTVRIDRERPPQLLVQLDLDLACRPSMEPEVTS